ncbi:hypothetical protein SCACP_11300 [Sporomusa carbonis]
MSLVLTLLVITPLAISRAFVDTNTYETVYVKPGDAGEKTISGNQ